ncbi:hypothetical protein B0T25DRAFT_565761 [Lasiosphaeria hispida]|uniref:Oxidoreductase n=1 Tax=Lasiosphaeria hispida TaxID=260671 RepID=A0AAJ0HK59_9PEZI|nr:hypothetical protein B0T25DRAFT_565761 [Lasiosphaeria hispida]
MTSSSSQRSPSPENSAPNDFPTHPTGIQHYTSTDAALAEPAVDVVIVCTPPNTHFALAREALRHGKHVLVGKPFVPTSAEADELAALARHQGLVICVYQNRRWNSDFLTVQKLLSTGSSQSDGSGVLGCLVEFGTHFDRLRLEKPTAWKSTLGMGEGGGVLYDLGTHLLDQVFVLFGMPTTVSAKFVNQREGRLVSGAASLRSRTVCWLFSATKRPGYSSLFASAWPASKLNKCASGFAYAYPP